MARPRIFHPENIQRRAEDLIAVGQEEAALQTMYDFLTSRRIRQAEPAELEPIGALFVELGTKLRNGKLVKDGLHQIKKTVQNADNGLESLEKITRLFIDLAAKQLVQAEGKAGAAAEVANEKSAAAAAAAQKVAETYEDDEEEDGEGQFSSVSPEDILMSAVSTDDTTDRSNRALVAPWIRFVWESLRAVLDLLRNNAKLEDGYATVANRAYQFCVDNNRKSEFRRLCEMIRTHLQSVSQNNDKYAPMYPIDLSSPDTLQRYLEMRFNQLTAAVKLELWQEAFRSVEDVRTLMTLSKRQPKPAMLMSYYDDLSKIFNVSDDQLFHAAARQRFSALLAQSPIATDEQRARYASLELLAALTVPETTAAEDELNRRKHSRLASLLSLSTPPTRESLLTQATLPQTLHKADPVVIELYQLVEKNFHPLSFARESSETLKKLEANPDYAPYLGPLRDALISRIIRQISEVYQTVKLDFLVKLCTLEGSFMLTALEVEHRLLKAADSHAISIKIDEEAQVVTFESDPFADSETSTLAEKSVAAAQLSPADFVRYQLSNLAKALSESVKLIDVTETEAIENDLKQHALEQANAEFVSERAEILHRYDVLDERKKKLEELKEAEAEAEAKAKIERDAARKEERKKQSEEDAKRRQIEKSRREIEAAREKEKQKMIKEVNSKGIIQINPEEAKDMDVDKLHAMQLEKLAKDAKETESKTDTVAKRADYLERAMRLAEQKALAKDAEDEQVRQKEEYDASKKKRIDQAKAQHEHDLKEKARLSKLVPDYQAYVSAIKAQQAEKYAAAKAASAAKLEEAKKQRIQEYIAKKKAEHEAAILAQKQEEEAKAHAAEQEKQRAIAEQNRLKIMEEEKQKRLEQMDPDRKVYADLKQKEASGSLKFSDKMKLKKLAAKYEH